MSSGFGRGPVPGQAARQSAVAGGLTPRTARLRLVNQPAGADGAAGPPAEWPLDALRTLVGRADPPATCPQVDLGPCDTAQPSSVSRRHAELYWHDGRLLLVDLGSTNGTQLNGRALAAPGPRQPGAAAEVSRGDRLRFGLVECEVV